MTINIVGAGIGGLTTAIALQQYGIATNIYEQAEELKPVGAGIILANNAMQVYKKLGLKKEIEEMGHPISSVNITDRKLHPISKINLQYFEKKHGVQNIAIHRGALQKILLSRIKSINLGHKLISIEYSDDAYNLYFDNGQRVPALNIVGADGIYSSVRKYIFPEAVIRNADQTCWRGIAQYSLPKKHSSEFNEAWGYGERIGFVQVNKNQVYWYAVLSNRKELQDATFDLKYYFKDFHPLMQNLIQSTDTSQIHKAELEDLKPMPRWYYENICLIGDAAHAATPNLGQGACQAIEDAFFLAKCISTSEINLAFRNFQNIRMTKAHQIVKTSWRFGQLSHLKNPLLARLRNTTMRWTPASLSRKQSEKLFELGMV